MAVKFVVGFVVACLVVVALADHSEIDRLKLDEATMKLYKMDCKAETGFDYEKEDTAVSSDTAASKCYLKCMGVKVGLISENGEPIYDKADQLYEAPEGMDVRGTMKACFEEHKDETDICEKVFEMEKCVSNEAQKHKKAKK